MRLLHLSDIHFKAPDCLQPLIDPERPYRTRLKADLVALCAEKAVDAILVSGDIAFKGHPDEFAVAYAWLKELAAASGCPTDRIYVVPGNHDVDRSVCKGSMAIANAQAAIANANHLRREAVLRTQLNDPDSGLALFKPLAAYNAFASPLGCFVSPAQPYWYYNLDDLGGGVTLRLHGLTSTLISGLEDRDDQPGRLYLSPLQTVLDPEPDVLNLVMSHHPPRWFLDEHAVDDAVNDRADILGGREAMPVFCTFHRLTSGPVSPNKLHEAIEMVDEPGPLSTSDLARAQVADYVLSNVEDADTRALDFLWDQWHYIEPSRLQQRLPDVAAPLWRASQRRLLAALRNPADDAAGWAAQMLKAVPTEDLLADWPERDVPLRELLRARPDLVEVPAFWAVVDVRSAHDLNGLPMTDTAAVALVHGMEREPGMRAAVQALGRVHVLKIVQLLSGLKDSDGRELRWVRYCVDDASAVAEFMSQVQAPAQALLMEFARTVSPDSVPNQYGDDPWYTALLELRNAKGSLPHRLAAYAFARALGRSSRNIGELLQMTFEQLHAAVSNSALADDDWRLIEPRLSWVSDDKRWNRAGRLRNAVASAYLDRHLWPRGFAWMASDNSVFVALMEETAERWGGKRFLKTVEESLEQETDALWRARRELIHWFLKRK